MDILKDLLLEIWDWSFLDTDHHRSLGSDWRIGIGQKGFADRQIIH
jgi:hypothetical protein